MKEKLTNIVSACVLNFVQDAFYVNAVTYVLVNGHRGAFLYIPYAYTLWQGLMFAVLQISSHPQKFCLQQFRHQWICTEQWPASTNLLTGKSVNMENLHNINPTKLRVIRYTASILKDIV